MGERCGVKLRRATRPVRVHPAHVTGRAGAAHRPSCRAWSGGDPPRPVSCTGRWDGAGVSVEARIIAFMSRRRGQLFCDDCLRRELQLTQHAAVEQATESVGAAVGFRRATETCARCGRVQAGSRLGPNPADPHRNDRPTGNARSAILSRKRPDCGDTLTFHTGPYSAALFPARWCASCEAGQGATNGLAAQ
jgi:hypothetical protein